MQRGNIPTIEEMKRMESPDRDVRAVDSRRIR